MGKMKMEPAEGTIQWLLEGPAWVRFRTLRELMNQPDGHPEVLTTRKELLQDGQVHTLLLTLKDWPGKVLNSHKSAGHPIHLLSFMADLGLTTEEEGIIEIVRKITAHQDPLGPFHVLMNIPTHFGGTGKDQWCWAPCDAPLLLYALVKFGLQEDPRVKKGIAYLAELVRENGWPCASSKELGKFRGPGRKEDPCPIVNLLMLKLLGLLPEWQDEPACVYGVNSLLNQWENRQEQHPYMFYMGTDFCKLKAPLVWFDILHVVEVLSHYPLACKDERMRQMVEIIEDKVDDQGRFIPESIWTAWKEFDFCQKKEPSRGLTLLVRIAFKRYQINRCK
jgi:hypothetical protein